MEVCRLRDTPIMTFINKLDREGREPLDLLDEIEKVLRITCAPITWPIGMGRELRGVYHLLEDRIYVYQAAEKGRAGTHEDYLAGRQTPVFFGSAINNFGVTELLAAFVEYAPAPLPRDTTTRKVD